MGFWGADVRESEQKRAVWSRFGWQYGWQYKLVYADPPFNSDKNYAAPVGSKAAGAGLKDTWTLSDVEVAWHGKIGDREPKVYAAIDNGGVVARE